MNALIQIVSPLTVVQTAMVALGAAAVVIISPQVIVATVRLCVALARRAAQNLRGCSEREVYDPLWMDAELYEQERNT